MQESSKRTRAITIFQMRFPSNALSSLSREGSGGLGYGEVAREHEMEPSMTDAEAEPIENEARPNFRPSFLLASWALRDASAFDAYFREDGHRTVKGWVTDGALSAVAVLSTAQRSVGWKGHVCEIGVHHGRYAVALSLLRQPGERTVAIDVFEDQQLNVDQSGKGDYAIFTATIKKWLGASPDVSVIRGDSLSVTAERVIDHVGGRIRLFSVDGSHTREHTLNDIAIAEGSLTEGGVVVVDDFFNPAWPGVPEAIFAYLAGPDRPEKLEPIGYGDNKFYFTTKAAVEYYQNVIANVVVPKTLRSKQVLLHGRRATFFTLPPPITMFSGFKLPIGHQVGFGKQCDASRSLGAGWYQPQAEGVWSQGDGGGLILELEPRHVREPVTLQLRFSLAISPGNSTPYTQVWANGRLVQRVRPAHPTTICDAKVVIEPNWIGPDGRIELWLRNPNPVSPRSVAINPDPRTLGVFLSTVSRKT